MSNDQTPDTGDNQPDIKSLRERAEQARQLEKDLAESRRELMFAKAGIDTSSKIGAMLYKTWDGDDVEALKAEATDLGLIGTTSTPPAGNPDVREQMHQMAQMREAVGGGQPAGGVTPEAAHPIDEAYENFWRDRKSGVPLETAQLAAIDRVIVAASNGDKRVLFDRDDWDRQRSSVGHDFGRSAV